MKIINLYAENLKRLTAVEISPDGNLVQITGRNGQGKTSVLDAIWWALAGTSNVQTAPIRAGEELAIIKLDLGSLKITRRFRAQEDGGYTTSIVVENDEGARFSSPQGMIDKLLGELTFDPLAFTRMKPQEQIMALRSLVPEFDFADAEAKNKADFENRKELNRLAKDALAAAEGLGRELPDTIPEPVSANQLMQEWQEATEHNNLTEARKLKRENFIQSREELDLKIKSMLSELQEMEDGIAQWDDLPDKIDADSIKAKIQDADLINDIVASAKRRDQLAEEAKSSAEKSQELTDAIASRKAAAKSAISNAKMPITGLSIEDGAVHLDSVPFNQASDAQQLQASIAIAMALNPTLKVIRVRDGSLLDEDAMKFLEGMAETSDYQIWIERVDSSGTVGFVLEDGHVKGQVIEAEPKAETPTKDASLELSKQSLKPITSMFSADRTDQ